MADVVTRLVVDSKEYDSKIQRAVAGLTQYEKKCREVGGTLEFVEKEDLDFVKALGQMETVSSSATGKLSELKKAFVELSVQYNKLTKEEKSGAYGKALASSLDQLKSRIKGAKSELSGIEGKLTGVGDAFRQVGSKMGIPMEMFTKLGPVVAAAGAAIKVATDAFKQNEVLMDEWGRTTEAAGTVYQGFLNALNTGDLGGFLRNIGNIISKSREAYDAMDQLGTFNAFNQIQIEGARTDFIEAMANYREGSGSKEDVKAAADRLKNEMQSRQDKEQAAYIAAIKELAASRGVDEEMLQKALSGTYGDYETLKATPLTGRKEEIVGANQFSRGTIKVTEFAATEEEKLGQMLQKLSDDELARIQALGAQAQRTATEIAQVEKQTVRVLGANRKTANTSTTTKKTEEKAPEGSIKAMREQLAELNKEWELAVDDDSRAKLKEQIEEVSAALDKMIGKTKEAAQIQTGPSGYSQEGISALRSEIQGGMKGMQIGSAEYMFEAERLVDLTTFENLMKTAVANGIQIDPATIETLFEGIDNAEFGVTPSVTDEAWEGLVAQINDKLAELNLPPITINVKTGGVEELQEEVKQTTDNVAGAAAAFSALGDAMSQIDDPGAKVAGMIAEAIGSVAAGYGAATAQAATLGPWAWIAFAVTGLATMISTIAGIKQATAGSYASGGIIPGNSYSGDQLTANVNSGELILNRAQQDSIAGQLSAGNPFGNLQLETRLSGTELLILLNNANRSMGGSRSFYTERH